MLLESTSSLSSSLGYSPAPPASPAACCSSRSLAASASISATRCFIASISASSSVMAVVSPPSAADASPVWLLSSDASSLVPGSESDTSSSRADIVCIVGLWRGLVVGMEYRSSTDSGETDGGWLTGLSRKRMAGWVVVEGQQSSKRKKCALWPFRAGSRHVMPSGAKGPDHPLATPPSPPSSTISDIAFIPWNTRIARTSALARYRPEHTLSPFSRIARFRPQSSRSFGL
ncbi:hypothetical protein L1887_51203 [Cichorium endivia]|nr:hypothetical protein L1887_51203 [Cichorium endivia]